MCCVYAVRFDLCVLCVLLVCCLFCVHVDGFCELCVCVCVCVLSVFVGSDLLYGVCMCCMPVGFCTFLAGLCSL